MARFLIEFQSKYLLRRTEIILYIPDQSLQETIVRADNSYYQNNKESYPLMLLLSGFGSSKTAWEQKSNVVDLAMENKVALCMIGGENKWYMNFSPIDNWEAFINIELPDYIYGNFKAISKEKPLYIAGCSMGGYGALRNYLLNIDKYKACCSLSPATKPDNNLEEVLKQKGLKDLIIETKDIKKNVYLSIGTKDFVYKQSMQYDKFLEECSCGFRYRSIEGYDHSYTLWNREIKEFFEYIKDLD